MLISLSIRNIALMDEMQVEFSSGLHVLTGETGAGKSILVDAVTLLLGGRAQKELIRKGESKARVEGVFDISDCPPVQKLLMEQELQQLRTMDGRPYRLLRLPMPRPIYDEGDRLPATYANYLVINGAVLVPTYNQPDLDAEAMRIIGEAYPDRELVGIDCRPVIRQHGSLHCCTMQYY